MPITFPFSVLFSRLRGSFLLEILISLFVLAVGMVGIAALLLIAHKNSSSSYLKQQGVQFAYNIIERMRANRLAAINGSYNINNLVASGAVTLPGAPGTMCNISACSATQLATYDTWYWLTKEVGQLPSGSASIITSLAATGGNTVVVVTVQWDDSPAQKLVGANSQTASGNVNLAQFTVDTLL